MGKRTAPNELCIWQIDKFDVVISVFQLQHPTGATPAGILPLKSETTKAVTVKAANEKYVNFRS
jgi:hypothetical protein